MATAIRATIEQPLAAGMTWTLSTEAIVDSEDDAREQGAEVYRLTAAFEEGFKAEAKD